MENNFVIFKNPSLRYRKETFGGIAKIILKTFILNKSQYSLINKIEKIIVYRDLSETEKKIADKLILEGLLLKVDIERAKELGFR
ncbi:MAG: hypothetical protein U9Q73_02825 [Nanoarchaeota archaeon]|nr:hypothetical protein [Nanoarchaeota archaeon]